MNDFQAQLRAFIERPLAKAFKPSDFKGLLRGIDVSGAEVVDHTHHLASHPPRIQRGVDAYKKMVHDAAVVRRTPGKIEGISRKALYSLPRPGNPQQRDNYLLKPYHESITPNVSFWMHHPIQGWAEMTNQGLYHAAGLGHMHQGVHVQEHDMGPEHEREPAAVIHMAHGAKYSQDMQESEYNPAMLDDLGKMGIMDFLTHNMDRHPHNLLVLPEKDEHGVPHHPSRLLAIDHGRSFQYKASVKNNDRYVLHPVLGVKVRIPDHLRPDPTQDDLRNYLGRWGIQAVDRFAHVPVNSPDVALPLIQHWWPTVRQDIVREFEHHLDGIKHPGIREHIRDNFQARTDFLDRILHNIDHFNGPTVTEDDFRVPIIPYQS